MIDCRLGESELHVVVSHSWIVTLRFTPVVGIAGPMAAWSAHTEVAGPTAALIALVDLAVAGIGSGAEILTDCGDRLDDRIFDRRAVAVRRLARRIRRRPAPPRRIRRRPVAGLDRGWI